MDNKLGIYPAWCSIINLIKSHEVKIIYVVYKVSYHNRNYKKQKQDAPIKDFMNLPCEYNNNINATMSNNYS